MQEGVQSLDDDAHVLEKRAEAVGTLVPIPGHPDNQLVSNYWWR
jgi:hypothetical protein